MATATATAAKSTHAAPEKPEMAAKKAFEFKIVKGKEEDIPAPVRTGAVLPFVPLFDTMQPGDHFPVSADFWKARDIPNDKNTPPQNKDRIRRAFYNWQAKDDKRTRLVLAFSDTFDGTKYVSTEVYMAKKSK